MSIQEKVTARRVGRYKFQCWYIRWRNYRGYTMFNLPTDL